MSTFDSILCPTAASTPSLDVLNYSPGMVDCQVSNAWYYTVMHGTIYTVMHGTTQ